MEETREQQQMYNMFRSCIYVILIVEIVMNLPVTTSNSMIAFVLDVFHRFKVFDSVATNDSKVSTSISEKMDNLVPAAKIADMATGWLAGQAARDFTPTERSSFSSINLEESPEFKTTKYFCKTNFNMAEIKKEEAQYVDLPKIYAFKDARQKEVMLNRNFARVNREIDEMIKSLLNSQ